MFNNWESGGHVIHECHVVDPENKDESLILRYERLVHVDHDYFISFDSQSRVLLFDRVSRKSEKVI
jgi:hypothetical protein